MSSEILIMSDSLALPREKPELVLLRNTWPALLKRKGFEIHQVSIGGATSGDLLRQSSYYNFFKGEAVVIQVGIVDCAPRFVSRFEKEALTKIPVFGNRILSILNSTTVKKRRKLTYTSLNEFERNLVKIRNTFSATSKVYFLEIVGGEGYEQVLPGIEVNINKYNKVLKSISGNCFIEYNKQGILMSDFHHLNEYGHQTLFEQLDSFLSAK